jgi:hypothetical protein
MCSAPRTGSTTGFRGLSWRGAVASRDGASASVAEAVVVGREELQCAAARLARAERRLLLFPWDQACQAEVRNLTDEVNRLRAAPGDGKQAGTETPEQ